MTIKEVAEKYHISQDTLRYYEKVKMIPPVHRTSGGIRDYQEEDIAWLEFALCMRNAGLPVESVIEYLHLFEQDDETIPARHELLQNQMRVLEQQKAQLEATIEHLSYKISKYEKAMKTGKLEWESDKKPPLLGICKADAIKSKGVMQEAYDMGKNYKK